MSSIAVSDLTHIQLEAWRYIGQRCYDTSVGPTVREVAAVINRSVQPAKRTCDELIALGLFVRSQPGKYGVLLFTEDGAKAWKRQFL